MTSTNNNYQSLALIVGIIGFVAYSWLEQQGIKIILNKLIKYSILLFGLLTLIFILFYFTQNNPFNPRRFKLNKIIIISLTTVSVLSIIISTFNIDYFNINTEKINSIISDNIILIIVIAVLILIFLVLKNILKKRKEKIKTYNKTIKKISETNLSQLNKILEARERIELIEVNNKRLRKYLQDSIKNTLNILERKEKDLLRKKEVDKRNYKLRKQREREIDEKINKLFEYFKEQETTKTIPTWARFEEQEIINEAKIKYKNYSHEQYEQERKELNKKEQEQKIINFILKHKALPSNYQELSFEEQGLYDKALYDLEEGTLHQKQEDYEVEERDKELITKKFFLANELSKEQKERFINKYGYKHKPFTNLDGSLGNNLTIKNTSMTESDYHFCTKHLIAKIDDFHSHIEYTIEDQRADIVFTYTKGKIAVEIETGKNNKEQIKKKIEWLNKHFKYCIITAPKKQHKKYKAYTNNKNSFCLGTKKTTEKIKELQEQLSN